MAHEDVPTDEEMAAALAAVRILLRRRTGRNPRNAGGDGSRWARAGRTEAVAALTAAVGWATAERPR